MGRVTCVVVAMWLGGCQRYDFNPVEPVLWEQRGVTEIFPVLALRPDVVLLIDRSGSMALPIDASDAQCPAGCGSGVACPASCPTRMSELRVAMDTFFSGEGRSVARWGLAAFPQDATACAGSTRFLRPLPPASTDDSPLATWEAHADALKQDLLALEPGGGTPTAASLRFVREAFRQAPSDRQRFVVLLTDGLPNCNEQNPNQVCVDQSDAQFQACACTLAAPGVGRACGSSSTCAIGCLDEGVVEAVGALQADGVETLVVGFGSDANTAAARQVFEAMAAAGGHPAFHADTASQLADVLFQVIPRPCEVTLPEPITEAEPIISLVNEHEQPYPRSDWELVAPDRIALRGDLCAAVLRGDRSVQIQVRVLSSL